jgi:hypothetical protein
MDKQVAYKLSKLQEISLMHFVYCIVADILYAVENYARMIEGVTLDFTCNGLRRAVVVQ